MKASTVLFGIKMVLVVVIGLVILVYPSEGQPSIRLICLLLLVAYGMMSWRLRKIEERGGEE